MKNARGTPLRSAASVVVLCGSLTAIGLAIDANDPIAAWLTWRQVAVALATTLWAAGCLCTGVRVARALKLRGGGAREFLAQAFALGVLAYALAIVGLGLVRGLGPVTFFALPVAFVLAGAAPTLRYLRGYLRRTARLRRPLPPLAWLALLYGATCVLALYLTVVSPANLTYDARWYHLPIAEHYAATGAVTRFDEGWFLGALPHLASWLYTWAFLLPFGGLADRIALAAHLEFAVLVGTVITLPVLVDRLLPRPRVRSAWAAFFLFPGILVYDSGLGGGADHVLAFWGAPIFLALLALLRRPNPASAVLLAALMSGAALTKYQAIYLLLAPGAAALIGARRCPRTVATLVVGLALLTAPHWLLNWLWYGNPAYPAAYAVFGGHPMAPTIEPRLPADHPFLLEGSFPERVLKTLRALLTFGFEAHDWSSFHGQRPVYGSLFLPALALALVVRVRHVVLGLAAAGLVGIAAWFWTYHEDRYLQALTPWLAACTLAGLASTWRQVPIARPLLALVVMLQLASCADLYFLGTHAMSGWPLQKSAELISSGFRRAYGERSNAYSGFAELDAMLPPDAKVLVHEQHIHLGLNRAAVRDARGRQGALAYAHLANSEMVLENLMRLGVTHAVWARNPMGHNLVGDDVVFYRFAQQLPGPRYTGSGLTVARLPDRLPRGRPGVAVIGCGVERLTPSDLSAQWMRLRAAKCLGPPPLALEAIADVDLVVTDTRLGGQQIPGFALLFARDEFQIWGRQP